MRAQKLKKSFRKQDPPKNKKYGELLKDYREKIRPLVPDAPFVLRVSRNRNGTLRLVAKERLVWMPHGENRSAGSYLPRRKKENRLAERGRLCGELAQAFVPFIRKLASRVNDNQGISLELNRFLGRDGLRGNWSLPLNEEIGGKICLMLRLLGTMRDIGRMQLIAFRIDTFSREEASYWLSRTTNMGAVYNRWAMTGLRLMLSGPAGNPHVEKALQKYLERK